MTFIFSWAQVSHYGSFNYGQWIRVWIRIIIVQVSGWCGWWLICDFQTWTQAIIKVLPGSASWEKGYPQHTWSTLSHYTIWREFQSRTQALLTICFLMHICTLSLSTSIGKSTHGGNLKTLFSSHAQWPRPMQFHRKKMEQWRSCSSL